MKIILWGAGNYGDRIFARLGADNIVAYIDNDPNKIGKTLHGKKIISLEEYESDYKDVYIVITMLAENNIGTLLQEKGIFSYFDILDCPGEYYSPENYLNLVRERILDKIRQVNRCYIYGDNFFAIDIADYAAKNKRKISIIIPPYVEENTKEVLKKGFPKLKFKEISSFEKLSELEGRILVANGWDYEKLSENVEKNKLINIFDTHEYVTEYYNHDLKKYKDIHFGGSCFIIGNGPSLRAEDLSLLKDNNIVSFGVNNINKIFSQTYWRPTYFTMSSFKCFEESDFTNPEDYSEKGSFIADNSREFWHNNKSDRNIKYHGIYRSSLKLQAGFSDDIVKGVYLSGTVIDGCIQIAVYMGFKNIFLLGNDLTSPQGENNHMNHFFEEKKMESVFYVPQFIKEFTVARKYAEAHGIKIYNATRGGFLEVFERIDFDSLFVDGVFTKPK